MVFRRKLSLDLFLASPGWKGFHGKSWCGCFIVTNIKQVLCHTKFGHQILILTEFLLKVFFLGLRHWSFPLNWWLFDAIILFQCWLIWGKRDIWAQKIYFEAIWKLVCIERNIIVILKLLKAWSECWWAASFRNPFEDLMFLLFNNRSSGKIVRIVLFNKVFMLRILRWEKHFDTSFMSYLFSPFDVPFWRGIYQSSRVLLFLYWFL